MRAHLLPLAALAVPAVLALAAAARPAAAQVVHGVVYDAATLQPLAEATVTLVDGRDSVIAGPVRSDVRGRFSLGAQSRGWLRLVARRVGYLPVRGDSLVFDTRDLVRFDVLMTENATRLAEVVITERHRLSAGELMQAEGFDWRRERERGTGNFYSGADLAEQGVLDVLEVFNGVAPHVQVQNGRGGLVVRGMNVGRNAGCVPAVFLNGFLKTVDPWALLASIPTEYVHGIEFYYGNFSIPREFRGEVPRACAVVAVWHRRHLPAAATPR